MSTRNLPEGTGRNSVFKGLIHSMANTRLPNDSQVGNHCLRGVRRPKKVWKYNRLRACRHLQSPITAAYHEDLPIPYNYDVI
jgi:hypothetical protein